MNSQSDKIADSALRGVFWIGGSHVIKQLIGIVTYILLARLLTPDDFGLMGMVMVFISFSMLFVEFGIGAAIIHSKELSELAIQSAFWINFIFSTVLALILAASAPLIADFYGNDQLSELTVVLALGLILSGMQVIPKALLQRSLHFFPIARAEVISSTVAALSALLMAWQGYGVWALVTQPIMGNIMLVLLFSYGAAWLPRMHFNWSAVRSYIHYSSGVLASNLLTFLNRNSDDFIIGKFLGSTALGYYTLAYQIMLYPLQQVSGIIVKVLFPSLSHLQDDRPRFRSMYLKAITSIAIITFPMMLGLLSVAEDFILVVFGEKWLEMLDVLRIFCILGMLQSVVTTVGTIYLSTGETKLMFKVTMYTTPFFIAAFLIGTFWGIKGVAICYALVSVIVALVSVKIAFSIVQIPVSQFYKVLSRPFLVCVLMAVTINLLDIYLIHDVTTLAVVRLVSEIIIGIVCYLLFSWLFNREQLLDITGKLFSLLRKK